MSIFSLNWFKSKKQKELEELMVEEQKLKNKILQANLSNGVRPYLTYKLVNNVLTVVLIDGEILTKSQATVKDIEAIQSTVSEFDIRAIMKETSTEKTSISDKRTSLLDRVSGNLSMLEEFDEFHIEDSSLYFAENSRSVPPLVADKIIEIVKSHDRSTPLDTNVEYLSLKRFFMWCCLNLRSEVIDKLYGFLITNSFRITRHGFFVALRNVVKIEESDNDRVEFISNAFTKVKAVWKQKPDNFNVYSRLGEFKLIERGKDIPNVDNPYWELVGNLKTLYLALKESPENRYTDNHTRTFDIRVGQVVSMPLEKCSWSEADCGEAGLHFTADEINYVGCGDTSVLILINPMKVVGIGAVKGRCYEYFPIMTVPREESTTILHDLDFDTIDLDEEYAQMQLESLEEKIKEGIVAESNKYEFNIPSLSSKEIKDTVNALSKMKDEIRQRVQKAV